MECFLEKYEIIVIGQYCWNTLGQIRSFGEIGIKSHVVWIENDSFTPQGSRYVKTFYSCSSFNECYSYLLKTFNKENKKYVISTDCDSIVSFLNQHYDELKDRFFFFNAGEQNRLSEFINKQNQILLAKKFGFTIPKTLLVKKGDIPKDINFPVFTKSVNSLAFNWKTNSSICYNAEELKNVYNQISDDQLIIQEFIEKSNEIAIEGISYNNGQDVFMPIQGEYLRIEDGSFGTWKINELYKSGEDLKSKIHSIMRHVRYNGVFEIEFIKDKNDKLYFLEINFRHTQYNHALTEMGVNFCQLFCQSQILGKIDIDSINIKSPSITMNEYREFMTYIKTGKYSIFKWINDIRKTDSFYFYDNKDKKYFYCKIADLIKNKFLSLFN